jgi:hypothetical protein
VDGQPAEPDGWIVYELTILAETEPGPQRITLRVADGAGAEREVAGEIVVSEAGNDAANQD